jgi:acyl transferase domain-containing protein
VNALLSPTVSECFTTAGVLSPSGRSRAFSADADGYVRAEGATVVVLKPLARARADGDRVYAVMQASAEHRYSVHDAHLPYQQGLGRNARTAPSRRQGND